MPFLLECCGGLNNVDYSKVDLSAMTLLSDYVKVTDPSFIAAVLSIAFNPLFWNLVGRWEHRSRSLTRVFRSPYVACYFLGAVIILLNFLRSHCFGEAMKSHPKLPLLDCLLGYYASVTLIAVGILLVTSSFLALGFIGTFLGKVNLIVFACGRASSQPRVLSGKRGGERMTSVSLLLIHPSLPFPTFVLLFCLFQIRSSSPVGLILTVEVALCYAIALLYEGPFTEEIYRKKAPKCK
ncbi:phosphatidylethanolamine N-methyltransferase [Thamnophis elegans]|uniref:phosphatidylethanolamine N-methyltransferase n=1 Tax=Thamnophis elegans TaxID=35005 RepID=UPI001378C579|nr:phosphatidylethanolamine N-methyltransferase [Thamnophis elegans]